MVPTIITVEIGNNNIPEESKKGQNKYFFIFLIRTE